MDTTGVREWRDSWAAKRESVVGGRESGRREKEIDDVMKGGKFGSFGFWGEIFRGSSGFVLTVLVVQPRPCTLSS